MAMATRWAHTPAEFESVAIHKIGRNADVLEHAQGKSQGFFLTDAQVDHGRF